MGRFLEGQLSNFNVNLSSSSKRTGRLKDDCERLLELDEYPEKVDIENLEEILNLRSFILNM